jgi:hypothetical protein
MKGRILNILASLTKNGSITQFGEVSENNFEVATKYSEFGHLTWLKFEVSGDVLRMRFSHLFGALMVENGADAKDLLRVLMSNRDSFKATSAYLSAEFDEHFFTYLENSHFYLLKWEDEDIADAISIQFLDLVGLGLGETPKPIRMFEQRSK